MDALFERGRDLSCSVEWSDEKKKISTNLLTIARGDTLDDVKKKAFVAQNVGPENIKKWFDRIRLRVGKGRTQVESQPGWKGALVEHGRKKRGRINVKRQKAIKALKDLLAVDDHDKNLLGAMGCWELAVTQDNCDALKQVVPSLIKLLSSPSFDLKLQSLCAIWMLSNGSGNNEFRGTIRHNMREHLVEKGCMFPLLSLVPDLESKGKPIDTDHGGRGGTENEQKKDDLKFGIKLDAKDLFLGGLGGADGKKTQRRPVLVLDRLALVGALPTDLRKAIIQESKDSRAATGKSTIQDVLLYCNVWITDPFTTEQVGRTHTIQLHHVMSLANGANSGSKNDYLCHWDEPLELPLPQPTSWDGNAEDEWWGSRNERREITIEVRRRFPDPEVRFLPPPPVAEEAGITAAAPGMKSMMDRMSTKAKLAKPANPFANLSSVAVAVVNVDEPLSVSANTADSSFFVGSIKMKIRDLLKKQEALEGHSEAYMPVDSKAWARLQPDEQKKDTERRKMARSMQDGSMLPLEKSQGTMRVGAGEGSTMRARVRLESRYSHVDTRRMLRVKPAYGKRLTNTDGGNVDDGYCVVRFNGEVKGRTAVAESNDPKWSSSNQNGEIAFELPACLMVSDKDMKQADVCELRVEVWDHCGGRSDELVSAVTIPDRRLRTLARGRARDVMDTSEKVEEYKLKCGDRDVEERAKTQAKEQAAEQARKDVEEKAKRGEEAKARQAKTNRRGKGKATRTSKVEDEVDLDAAAAVAAQKAAAAAERAEPWYGMLGLALSTTKIKQHEPLLPPQFFDKNGFSDCRSLSIEITRAANLPERSPQMSAKEIHTAAAAAAAAAAATAAAIKAGKTPETTDDAPVKAVWANDKDRTRRGERMPTALVWFDGRLLGEATADKVSSTPRFRGKGDSKHAVCSRFVVSLPPALVRRVLRAKAAGTPPPYTPHRGQGKYRAGEGGEVPGEDWEEAVVDDGEVKSIVAALKQVTVIGSDPTAAPTTNSAGFAFRTSSSKAAPPLKHGHHHHQQEDGNDVTRPLPPSKSHCLRIELWDYCDYHTLFTHGVANVIDQCDADRFLGSVDICPEELIWLALPPADGEHDPDAQIVSTVALANQHPPSPLHPKSSQKVPAARQFLSLLFLTLFSFPHCPVPSRLTRAPAFAKAGRPQKGEGRSDGCCRGRTQRSTRSAAIADLYGRARDDGNDRGIQLQDATVQGLPGAVPEQPAESKRRRGWFRLGCARWVGCRDPGCWGGAVTVGAYLIRLALRARQEGALNRRSALVGGIGSSRHIGRHGRE
jgi:hypothetical protein